MTHDEIENMPAGREMDKMVALMVMGFGKAIAKYGFEVGGRYIAKGQEYICSEDGSAYVPHYSTRIESAWLVVEKLETNEREILSKITRKGFDKNRIWWTVEFRECYGTQKDYYAEAETAPLAICRAALMAVMK